MKELNVIISSKAESDLADIWDSIAFENPTAADKFTKKLENRINQLRDFPQLGVSRRDINVKYRQLVEGRYLVLYEWVESELTVEIVRIIHSARNIRHLF